MSTPLGALIRSVLSDPDAQAAFASAPETFLAEHGYTELDPQDLREAFYVLAEGSHPDTAGRLVAGADAIGDDDVDGAGLDATAAGLVAALGAMGGEADALDPSTLDGLDDDDDVDAASEQTDSDDGRADLRPAPDDGDVDEADRSGSGDRAHPADDALTSTGRDTDRLETADHGDLADAAGETDPTDLAGADPDGPDADGSSFGSLDGDDLDDALLGEPPFELPAIDADVAPLVPDTTQPALPEDEVSDGWDDVI